MDNKEEKRKLKNPLAALERYKFVLLVAVLGILLLLWPQGRSDQISAAEAQQPQMDDRAALEHEMEEILTKIRGVGRVDVLLTLESGSELVLASDSELRYSGNTNAPDDYDRSNQVVTVSGSGGGQEVVITQQRCGRYRGALVVCQGAGNDAVALQVMEAVSALTGLGSDKIAVVPWQSGGQEGVQ